MCPISSRRPSSNTRFSSKSEACLLRQPGGFEGFSPVQICIHSHDPCLSQREEPAAVDIDLRAAAFTPTAHAEEEKNLVVACVEQLLRLPRECVELTAEPLGVGANGGVTAIRAGFGNAGSSRNSAPGSKTSKTRSSAWSSSASTLFPKARDKTSTFSCDIAYAVSREEVLLSMRSGSLWWSLDQCRPPFPPRAESLAADQQRPTRVSTARPMLRSSLALFLR